MFGCPIAPAAHDKGIVHRDIKPENIFLARRVGAPPIIKLLDFGVSKMMPEFLGGEEALDLTRTGMVMGTPYYMSPEQARGERNLDGRVDVYACGVVMYEAIVGKRPFLAPNYNALLLAIINTTPRPIRELRPKTPPELEGIIGRAMAKNRADRFPSAKHFLRELSPALAAAISPMPDVSPSRMPPPPPTAEERKRAPVVRGRPDAASAMLRQRMNEAHDATRIERRTPGAASAPYEVPRRPSYVADSDSIEIPIHVSGIDSEPTPAPADEFIEEATEVYRPDKHVTPRSIPPLPAHVHRAPLAPPPIPDDWEGETIVTRPPFEPPPAPSPPVPRRRRESRPFNPDETVKLDKTGDVELIDDRRAPPRRR